MIPVKSELAEVDTLPGEEVAFTISQANAKWVMNSLAKLYSDSRLATIRELSTNGADAQLEAGYDGPIEVTLPSQFDPYFVVVDHGVGMSKAELTEVYTQFGNSTKRENAEANGMLGFGSKAPLAYTNSFTVESVKNGRKTVAAVTRKADESLVLKVLVEVETSATNGTVVKVPVHDWVEFRSVAENFYKFWRPGTVTVNGKEPEWNCGDKLGDDLYMSHNNISYVVMGNVPYRINNPSALFPYGYNRVNFVAYVENGAVQFTPSREDLEYTDHTRRTLKRIVDNFVTTANDKATKEIKDASTHADAYTAWRKWRDILGHGALGDLEFKGEKLHDNFAIKAMRWNRAAYRNSTYKIDKWAVSTMDNTLIVTGFTTTTSSAAKAKVKEWLGIKNIHATYILFTDVNDVDSPWVDRSRLVSWSQIKADVPKKPRSATTTAYGRKAGTFDLENSTGTKYECDVPNTKNLYYVETKVRNDMWCNGQFIGINRLLDYAGITESVVVVPANRKAKFLREYPHAKNIVNVLTDVVELDGAKLVDDDAKRYYDIDGNYRTWLSLLPEDKIDDPELVLLIKSVKKAIDPTSKDKHARHWSMAKALRLTFKPYEPFRLYNSGGSERPLQHRYPLFNYDNVKHHREAFIEYLNLKYKAIKEAK